MSKWNPLFVNEMSHAYRRFLKTKDKEEFTGLLRKNLLSNDKFEVAFTAGLVKYLEQQGIEILVEIPHNCSMEELVYPTMYTHPALIKREDELRKDALPEFLEYGIALTYFN